MPRHFPHLPASIARRAQMHHRCKERPSSCTSVRVPAQTAALERDGEAPYKPRRELADDRRAPDVVGRGTCLHPDAGGRGAPGESHYLRPPVLPLIETFDMPLELQLVPVAAASDSCKIDAGGLEVALGPHSRGGRPSCPHSSCGGFTRSTPEGLRQIVRDLNASKARTAHGAAQWWPSTARADLGRSSQLETSARSRGSSPVRALT